MSSRRSQLHRRLLRRLRAMLVAALTVLVALGAAAPAHAAAAACGYDEANTSSCVNECPDDDGDDHDCPPTCNSCPCGPAPFVPNAVAFGAIAEATLAEILARDGSDAVSALERGRGLERPPRS